MDNTKLIQGSPEWHEARRGKITGSRFKDVMSTRGNTRANYMRELLLERKTGIVAQGFSNADMEWGIQYESQARTYYEKLSNVTVEQVGFINHPLEQYRSYVGVSPDGLVDSRDNRDFVNGSIEIKCPNTNTHMEYIVKGFPAKYRPQVQGILWVTGRDWCDFISFDPRVEKQPFWCIRVERDEAYIRKLATAVDEFIQEMVEMKKNQVEVDPQLLIDVTEGGCSEADWQVKLKDEIRGKVRMHVVCAILTTGEFADLDKKFINAWVDFIMTGE